MRNKSSNSTSSGLVKNLENQLDTQFQHFNEGSFKTRERYKAAMERFVVFLASEFRLQKITNISSKHLIQYVNHMKQDGKSPSTIKTDVSAIRYFQHHCGSKNILVDNSILGLDKRQTNKTDNSWTTKEVEMAKQLSKQMGRIDVYFAITLSENFGLRLEECCRLTVDKVLAAIDTGELEVKGKGGQTRFINVETLIQFIALAEILKYADTLKKLKCDKILVDNIKDATKKRKDSIQNWLGNHRDKFQEAFRNQKSGSALSNLKPVKKTINFHGLRSYYSNNLYNQKKNILHGKDLLYYISEQLGHHRAEITRIYLKYKKVPLK